jgi:hypothetical protein
MFASLSRTLLVLNSTFEARTSREAEVLVLRVWRLDTAHHSFTFANAVHQAIQRAPSAELVRVRCRDEHISEPLPQRARAKILARMVLPDPTGENCWSRSPVYLTVSSRWIRRERWSLAISRAAARAPR